MSTMLMLMSKYKEYKMARDRIIDARHKLAYMEGQISEMFDKFTEEYGMEIYDIGIDTLKTLTGIEGYNIDIDAKLIRRIGD